MTAAKRRLFEAHICLAEIVAHKYRTAELELDDRVQESLIGLWEACNRWDKKRGVPFKAYAQRMCRNRITDAVRRTRLGKRGVPRNIRKVPLEEWDAPTYEVLSAVEGDDAVEFLLRNIRPSARAVVCHAMDSGARPRAIAEDLGISERCVRHFLKVAAEDVMRVWPLKMKKRTRADRVARKLKKILKKEPATAYENRSIASPPPAAPERPQTESGTLQEK